MASTSGKMEAPAAASLDSLFLSSQLWRAAGLRKATLAVDASCYDGNLLQNPKVPRIHPVWRNTASCSADKQSSEGGGRQTASSGRQFQQYDSMPASSWGSGAMEHAQPVQQELTDITAVSIPQRKRSRRGVKRNAAGWIAQAAEQLAPDEEEVAYITSPDQDAGVQGPALGLPIAAATTPLMTALMAQAFSMQAQLAAACAGPLQLAPASLQGSGVSAGPSGAVPAQSALQEPQSSPSQLQSVEPAQVKQEPSAPPLQEPQVAATCFVDDKACTPSCSPSAKGECVAGPTQPNDIGSPRCNSSSSSQHGYHAYISSCGTLDVADVMVSGLGHAQAV
uniref:Uncharacterized protein n=1 Tax=Chlamydomonas leiostraca TaxID=1034604 RepID=A0A7S0WPK6_9CHLO|mmetsp:Transcript_21992/g.55985  ORF Transcript_21992/g.55985 Transcript_21992/m.55985 type:complete len:337 (+) Transcript_21992:357-1367(+)|eukprot:CAMPEP_0202865728 /NCGR_PEP_ID=MMETSP1391-20130828/6320_1 /ASSEMBLY_ACC=CAM_ASM_000867 /TAXON_ID=1034604 /ORGANISM="Chlamydomonas leiostraca, Strain SAG 11-49" /LENGTH=336 /DNA_ID=CAMNT_0049545599 /DNA_START=354 /DNA_END=1364 /DNA_ORIENTATION=-